MPELGGRALAHHLRREDPDLNVLFVSGYAHRAEARMPVRLGRTAFLPKPFDASTLLNRVRALLDA